MMGSITSTHDRILGMSCAAPGAGLDVPCGSNSGQSIIPSEHAIIFGKEQTIMLLTEPGLNSSTR